MGSKLFTEMIYVCYNEKDWRKEGVVLGLVSALVLFTIA